MVCNLVRHCAPVALMVVIFRKGDLCSYLLTPGSAAGSPARLSLSGLRKFSAAGVNPKVFKDDSPAAVICAPQDA
jgi:hypothetical protein